MSLLSRNKGKLIKLSKISLIAFITVLLSLVVTEAYFVFFNPQGATNFWQEDAHVGIMHKPDMEGTYARKEFSTYIKINSAGFRGNEWPLDKDPNTTRIAVLGDSFVEAFQVPVEKSFPYLLEEILNNSSAGRRYEVLNFGMGSIGTDQEYLILKNYALKYDPDIVILAFYA